MDIKYLCSILAQCQALESLVLSDIMLRATVKRTGPELVLDEWERDESLPGPLAPPPDHPSYLRQLSLSKIAAAGHAELLVWLLHTQKNFSFEKLESLKIDDIGSDSDAWNGWMKRQDFTHLFTQCSASLSTLHIDADLASTSPSALPDSSHSLYDTEYLPELLKLPNVLRTLRLRFSDDEEKYRQGWILRILSPANASAAGFQHLENVVFEFAEVISDSIFRSETALRKVWTPVDQFLAELPLLQSLELLYLRWVYHDDEGSVVEAYSSEDAVTDEVLLNAFPLLSEKEMVEIGVVESEFNRLFGYNWS
jgi:hypothetical protein